MLYATVCYAVIVALVYGWVWLSPINWLLSITTSAMNYDSSLAEATISSTIHVPTRNGNSVHLVLLIVTLHQISAIKAGLAGK